MSGYAFDPTEPLPKRWKDKNGPIRLMMTSPVEGYVMARRPGGAPFILSVTDLLSGWWEPILPTPKTNVRQKLAEIKAAQEAELLRISHGE
jgi:hypothetical protein